MQPFVQALVNLYDLAEQVPHKDFPAAALGFLRPWIEFDGALLWMGEIGAGVAVQRQSRHAGDKSKLVQNQCPLVARLDSLIHGDLGELAYPIQWDCHAMRQRNQALGLEHYVQQHALHHIMLFGDHATPHKPGRWLALYRSTESPFSATDAERLNAAWPHLVRSLEMSRTRELDRLDRERLSRACALVNNHGIVLSADSRFHSLLRMEWGDYQRQSLPHVVMNNLVHGKNIYRGRHIEITFSPQLAYLSCEASTIASDPDLTPGEYMVARRYATGLSHKKIALELGISPHTVRNQIARLYCKLGVHDKAALAQYLAPQLAYRERH